VGQTPQAAEFELRDRPFQETPSLLADVYPHYDWSDD
jgi:hypothetical protein